MTDNVTADQQLQADNPSAPDYDWQKDREWLNQRLANARIHNHEIVQKNAKLRADIEDICQQRATSPITRARLRHAIAGVDWRKVK